MWTTEETFQPKSERLAMIDQAMELARMMPMDDPARNQLLHAAALVWMACFTTVAVIQAERYEGPD